MTGQKDKKETEEMATKINISYSLKQNGIVSCWWHSVAGANRYSAFIKLVANGKAIGTSFTAATELMSSEKVIAGGVYRIIVSARDAKKLRNWIWRAEIYSSK